MTGKHIRTAPSRRLRRGYTLLELLISSATASALMAGLGASVFVAAQTFDQNPATQETTQAEQSLAQMLRDAQTATSISELTATAATFTIPDRDGDGSEETIRYAWSGVPGDPLTYQYNAGAAVVLTENVQNFEMSYLSRFMEGTEITIEVLYIQAKEKPSSYEQSQIDQLAAWGFNVTTMRVINVGEKLKEASGDAHVVYVSPEVDSSGVGADLASLTIGVVTEQYALCSALGFGERYGTYSAADSVSIEIADNSHYIASSYNLGDLEIVKEPATLFILEEWSSDAQQIARIKNTPVLVALEKGDTTHQGRETPGSRVLLPWGGEFGVLNEDGLTLMKRSIEWAAADEVADQITVELDAGQDSWFSGWLK